MSSAFKCDRCYKLIEGTPRKEIRIDNNENLLQPYQVTFAANIIINVTIYKDFCNKCIIDLLRIENKM